MFACKTAGKHYKPSREAHAYVGHTRDPGGLSERSAQPEMVRALSTALDARRQGIYQQACRRHD
jgi:hypothetical protein